MLKFAKFQKIKNNNFWREHWKFFLDITFFDKFFGEIFKIKRVEQKN